MPACTPLTFIKGLRVLFRNNLNSSKTKILELLELPATIVAFLLVVIGFVEANAIWFSLRSADNYWLDIPVQIVGFAVYALLACSVYKGLLTFVGHVRDLVASPKPDSAIAVVVLTVTGSFIGMFFSVIGAVTAVRGYQRTNYPYLETLMSVFFWTGRVCTFILLATIAVCAIIAAYQWCNKVLASICAAGQK